MVPSSSASRLLTSLTLLLLFPCLVTKVSVSAAEVEAVIAEDEPSGYCSASMVREYDASAHEPSYTIGVLAIRGEDQAYNEWNTTFGSYLTATAGRRFDPPIRFSMKPLSLGSLFEEHRQVDFIYVNPSAFSCIASEHGAQSLASQISRRNVDGKQYDLVKFGGVIATLANSTVNTLQDLKGKIVAAASISGLGSGQMQFREMQKAGLSYINDPKQLVFTSNQGKVVKGLLSGQFDVGFIRTDQLERFSHSDKDLDTFLKRFKIVNPQPNLTLEDGMVFPFESSTMLYPEWNVASLMHVDEEVSRAVQESLTALAEHASVGQAYNDCLKEYGPAFCSDLPFPGQFALKTRSDTTLEIAQLAYTGMVQGKYAGWRTTLSYMDLRSMQEGTGFLRLDEESHQWRCVRSKELYNAITCPDGFFRKTPQQVQEGCSGAGLECPEGMQCVCQPCLKGFDVDVYPITSTNNGVSNVTQGIGNGCAKMSLCGATLQRKPLKFRAFDNLKRADLEITVLLHEGQTSREVPVVIDSAANHTFEFTLAADLVGVMTLEVFANGQQIPESPLRVLVEDRACEEEFGEEFEATSSGECVCKGSHVTLKSGCVAYSILLPAIIVPICALIVAASYWYAIKKQKEADAVWRVNPKDLVFAEPRVVLGQGTFGQVLLGEYFGTKVAIKRVLPPKKRGKTSGNASGARICWEGQDVETGKPQSNPVNVGMASADSVVMESMTVDKDRKLADKNMRSSFGLISGYQVGTEANRYLRSDVYKGSQFTPKTTSLPFLGASTAKHNTLKQDFIQEMRLLSSLRHPSITTVMGAVIDPKSEPMLVLEYLLITSGFRAKVSDFGLSQKKKNAKAMGTPYFMAPELLRGEAEASPATDIYSVGIILNELYSRKDPYEGEDCHTVLTKVCDPNISLRPPIPPGCPKEITQMMKLCWSGNPTKRPTAEALDERLKLFDVGNVQPGSMPLSHHIQNQERKTISNEDFLYKVFPQKIADSLVRGDKIEPESHDCVTIFFSDIVGFTTISSTCSPLKVSDMLDRLYVALDALTQKHELFKVETIGDAFMAVSNLIEDQSWDHVKRVAEFSLEAIEAASKISVDLDDTSKGFVEIRCGFHSGPVVSNVVGSLNPRYGLFGDSVNVASRMESTSQPGRVNCSAEAAELLMKQAPQIPLRKRGEIEIKGKGLMSTYFVGRRASVKV
ncbi:Receptor-type guanylate cyclase gcy [Seminavis robusta]|uniref:guanylate cyclase n=1 Tax=Seminavis robusta TaxID=568900 RepID=A0A9N8D618_9STRA|nr:Receptor-type guanylate cyclase gcy [Seminavis robusta]|eukprot:Sro9_g007450.1 Receptor-type guanylate cyclase gcy (1195) ;mRNA; r:146759-151460